MADATAGLWRASPRRHGGPARAKARARRRPTVLVGSRDADRYYTVLKNCSVFRYTTPSRTNGNRTVLRSERTCAMHGGHRHSNLNRQCAVYLKLRAQAVKGAPAAGAVRTAAPCAAPLTRRPRPRGWGCARLVRCLLDFQDFPKIPQPEHNRLVPLALRPRPVLLLGDRPRLRDRDLRHSRLDPHGNGPQPRGPQRTRDCPGPRRRALGRACAVAPFKNATVYNTRRPYAP